MKHNEEWKMSGPPYLYKQNNNTFRAIWNYDHSKKELYVYYVWLDHDKYEKEFENKFASVKSNNTKNFVELLYQNSNIAEEK